MKLQTRCQLGLQSSEALSEAAGSTSNLIHSHAWHVVVESCQETSSLHHMDLSIGLIECSHDIEDGFLQKE